MNHDTLEHFVIDILPLCFVCYQITYINMINVLGGINQTVQFLSISINQAENICILITLYKSILPYKLIKNGQIILISLYLRGSC